MLEDEGPEHGKERRCPSTEERNNWSRFEPFFGGLGQDSRGGQRSLKSVVPTRIVVVVEEES